MKTIEALKNSKTDEEKIKLLDKIVEDLNQRDAIARFSSIIGKLVYAINALCAFIFALYILCDAEEITILKNMLPICSDIAKFIGKWNTSMVSLIVFLVIFVLVIPVLCSCITKLILKLCYCKKSATQKQIITDEIVEEKNEGDENGVKPDVGTSLKEKSKETYHFISSNRRDTHAKAKRTSSTSAAIALIAAAIFTAIIIQLPKNLFSVSILVECIALSFVAIFLTSQILLLFIKSALAYGGASISPSEVNYLEKLWLENDPEEVEKRRKAEELEAQRRRAEEERKARMPKITFRVSGISSANTLTVYVDGNQEARFDGGRDRTISLTPGNHTIQVAVYNDASESAYRLDPISHYFQDYENYEIDYN